MVVLTTMVVSVMTEDYHFGYLLTGGGTWRYTSPHHTLPYRQRAHQGQYLYSSLLVFMDLSSLRVYSTDKRYNPLDRYCCRHAFGRLCTRRCFGVTVSV